jgi:hypothetical protein
MMEIGLVAACWLLLLRDTQEKEFKKRQEVEGMECNAMQRLLLDLLQLHETERLLRSVDRNFPSVTSYESCEFWSLILEVRAACCQ